MRIAELQEYEGQTVVATGHVPVKHGRAYAVEPFTWVGVLRVFSPGVQIGQHNTMAAYVESVTAVDETNSGPVAGES